MWNYSSNSWQQLRRFASVFLCLGIILQSGGFVMAEEVGNTTVIETGDAVAALEVSNTENLTTITGESVEVEAGAATTFDDITTDEDAAPASTSPETSTTDPAITQLPVNESFDTLSSTTASSSGTASTTATTTAETGQNEASGKTVTIDTGEAVATMNVVNVLNTTLIDADGLITFIDDVLGVDDLDLRNDFIDIFNPNTAHKDSTLPCSLTSCLDAQNSNANSSATISNTLIVRADTGGNSAAGETSQITTGDAYASANVINVANTTIVDSSYLLLIFNNFDDYAGDIVLPNSDFFQDFLMANQASLPQSISTEHEANVTNTLSVISDTGSNNATGSSSEIKTGEAHSFSTVSNTINQSIVGSNAVSLLIRVHGDWAGNIFGLPDGMAWEETPDGIRIFATDGSGHSSFQSENTSSATITNDITVFALTGDNQAAGETAKIETGDAYAQASVMNLANSTIVGSNWASLIFNIYGNWTGNLSFGLPNLWIGGRVESAKTPIMPGDKVTYTYTIFNAGDLSATDVTLTNTFESETLRFHSGTSHTPKNGLTTQTWSLGTIPAGATREFSYEATAGENLPKNTISSVPLMAELTSNESDEDLGDNTETITINVGQITRSRGVSKQITSPATLDVVKTADRDTAMPGDIVSYTVTITNTGGPLFDAALIDVLEDESGKVISESVTPLNEIKSKETITITYSIELSASTTLGVYKNTAQVAGLQGSRKTAYQSGYISSPSTHILSVGPTGQVLGESASCMPYLTSYLRINEANDQMEVNRLQSFLQDVLSIPLEITGIFDRATFLAVQAFQVRYKEDVLTPWGLSLPTGNVYYTTQKKINELACAGAMEFPLTNAQLTEIATARLASAWIAK